MPCLSQAEAAGPRAPPRAPARALARGGQGRACRGRGLPVARGGAAPRQGRAPSPPPPLLSSPLRPPLPPRAHPPVVAAVAAAGSRHCRPLGTATANTTATAAAWLSSIARKARQAQLSRPSARAAAGWPAGGAAAAAGAAAVEQHKRLQFAQAGGGAGALERHAAGTLATLWRLGVCVRACACVRACGGSWILLETVRKCECVHVCHVKVLISLSNCGACSHTRTPPPLSLPLSLSF